MDELIPRAIVHELDRYIIGQKAAKRALAIALRNRLRRRMVSGDLRREIKPHNILMIGPTGVGKTELARRVAELLNAPFLRVEATKFTEVGYVGRDVESIVHDLADVAVSMVHGEKLREVEGKAADLAAERILTYLCQQLSGPPRHRPAVANQAPLSLAVASGGASPGQSFGDEGIGAASSASNSARPSPRGRRRKELAALLANRQLEDAVIEIELAGEPESMESYWEFSTGMTPQEVSESFNQFMQHYSGVGRKRHRRVSVRDARRLLAQEEAYKLIDPDLVVENALQRAEESGVVFIDELDKLTGPKVEVGPDVSGEGVQRDLLPVIEGCTVMTRYGPMKTDHILFITAGGFYDSKPSDLIPELQGRFPVRVELDSLSQDDLQRILTEPENALTKQYQALLATEEVELEFAPDGIAEIARTATLLNQRMENIGARRLNTVLERVLEEHSYDAPEHKGERIVVDAPFVRSRLAGVVADEDLSRYIL